MAGPTWNTDLIVGKDVRVNGVSTLAKLKIDNRASKSPMMASNLSGGVDRPSGIRELNGYYWAYGDTPAVFPNDLFDLAFTLDSGTSAGKAVQIVNAGGAGYGVRCRAIEIIAEPYTPGKENLVYYIVHFGGAGNDITLAGAGVPADTSAPIKYNTKGLGLQINDATICYIAGMHLKIQSLADADYSSCLNGIAYYPAGYLDWSLEVTRRINAWPANISPAGATGYEEWPDLDAACKLFVATQTEADLSFKAGWTLEYGKLGGKSGEFDHKTRLPLTIQYLFEKCGIAGDLGSIQDPAGVTQWP